MKGIIQLFTLCFLWTSCQEPSENDTQVTLNEAFLIKESTSIPIDDGTDRSISFTHLVSDSTCPSDVNCFRWGNMIIEVQIGEEVAELSLGDLKLPQEAIFGDLEVRLVNLAYPLSAAEKSNQEVVYEVQLIIIKV